MIENSRQNHRLRGLSDFTDSLALRVLRAGARISFLATLIFALPAFASTPLLNLRQAPSVEEESYQKEISESLHLTDQTQNDAAGVRVAKNGGALSLTINQNYSEKANKAYKHIFVGTQRLVTKLVGNNPKKLEDAQWYYSGDHLSSTSYVTNANGDIVEHLAYFPYGETWVQEKDSLPINFGFTAKELDEETGYYYFGARYYDPRVSTWVSTDPALGKFVPTGEQTRNIAPLFPFGQDKGKDTFEPFEALPSRGGIYESTNLNVYNYASQSPVNLVDPDGNHPLFHAMVRVAQAVGPVVTRVAIRVQQSRAGQFLIRHGLMSAPQESQVVRQAAQVPLTNVTVMSRALMNEVRNPRLLRTVDKLFKAGDTLPGGTAGAIRNELATGMATKGKFHSQAGKEMISRLNNIMKEEKLDPVDKRIAIDLIKDIKDALKIE